MKRIKLYLLIAVVITIIGLPSCFSTVHETSVINQQMSFNEATAGIKESIKDTQQNPYFAQQKAVSDVLLYEDGFTLIHPDGSKKSYSYSEIINPAVVHESFHNLDVIKLKENNVRDAVLFNNQKSAIKFANALSYLKQKGGQNLKQESAKDKENYLRQVRNTPVDLVLAGTTAADLNLPSSGLPQDQVEETLNDMLVEWKSKGLRGLLQRSNRSQLNDLVVKMEKGILKLDLKAKELKDAADEDARQPTAPGQAAPVKTAPAGALKTAHLLEQRKTILMVLLAPIKQTAVQKGD